MSERVMTVTHEMTNQHDDEQAKLWKGSGGRAWVDTQEVLDQIFKPLEALLVDTVSKRPGGRVLDVGCGTGSTTLAFARLLAGNGSSVGIDISDPMIAAARARAKRKRVAATFICADAQVYPFEPASVDTIVSRLGVMFFSDPIQAFANLRRAAANAAVLRFIAWRSAAENPFMTTAERAAASLLPNLPARKPDAPGQFAFASRERIRAILAESGWNDIDIQPIDVVCTFPANELVRYITRMGPVGLALQDADDRTRAQIVETVPPAFDSYLQGDEVRFTAACWTAGARS